MSENTNPILMTQAEYARHRNKSPKYIGKLYKAGILVMRGRLVDVAAFDAVLTSGVTGGHAGVRNPIH
jgi:hypothetical protein